MKGYDPQVEAELVRLASLDLHGLRDDWPRPLRPSARLRSPDLLRRLLAWRLQEAAYRATRSPACRKRRA